MDRLRIALVALGLAICMGATAATASAAVPGWELVTSTSETNSHYNKWTDADCPSGKQALGGGGSISGGAGQIGMITLGSSVLSFEDQDGFSGNWSQTAWIICANPLPGLETVFAKSGVSSAFSKAATASCPPGKRVISAGVLHDGAVEHAGEYVLDDLRMNSTLTSVTAISHEDQDGTLSNWAVSAQAVCAFPPAGLEFVKSVSAKDSASAKNAVAGCPAGKRVLGAGGEIHGAVGQVRFTSLFPLSFFGDGAFVSAAEDQDGTAAAWEIRAYAVCATA